MVNNKNPRFSFLLNNSQCAASELEALALRNLKEYLQIPSVQPDVNYDTCVTFLKKQAKSLDLPVRVIELHPKKPIVIITWEGREPDKPSILLNGHMDVVPVFPDEWTHPPFGAEMDEKGNIYARGAQDMKSLTIQQLETVRRLKLRGIQLKRTIHISVVPDEEINGIFGMKGFVNTEHFKALNVGFALDEGIPHPVDKFYVFYGEKTAFRIWVHCPGTSGHGSSLFSNTAAEKLQIVIELFMKFRETEKTRSQNLKQMKNVTSINLTMLKGGVHVNVVPNVLSAAFDIRVSPFFNFTKFEEMLDGWLKEAGEGVYYTTIIKDSPTKSTTLDSRNIYWGAFKKACDDNSIELETDILIGASDARYLRALGIPVLGFAPINHTPIFVHANNEFLNKDVFLNGIKVYAKVVEAIANA